MDLIDRIETVDAFERAAMSGNEYLHISAILDVIDTVPSAQKKGQGDQNDPRHF